MSSFFHTYFLGELAILGELASVLVGLGIKIWVQVVKDLFYMDGKNFENIFAGVWGKQHPPPI